jgi:glycosyltransferase involved in cell wall biosynthesis
MTAQIPEITVAMPVYNSEIYLEEALECILAQSFKNFEVIISDNCSTDRTCEIVENFAAKDSRVQLIKQEENIGAMANFGALLEYAQGKYFLWRAYDDWSDENYIEELHQLMSNNPECALAVPRIQLVNPDKSLSTSIKYPNLPVRLDMKRIKKLLKASQPGWIYGLYRLPELRSAFKQAYEGFPHIWAQDHLIILPFLLHNQVQGTNNTVFYQRITGIGGTTYRPKTLITRWKLVRDFYLYCRQCLSQSTLKTTEKRRLFWPIIVYTNGRSEKFKRVVRPFLAWPFIRPYEILSGKDTGRY